MSTNVSYLPEPDTEEALELITEFQSCADSELEILAKKKGYKSKHTFQDAMRRRLNVTRIPKNVGWEPSGINIPLKIGTQDERKTAVIINDTQNPYHDAETMRLVEIFLQEIEFHYLIYNGDVNDFYLISVFDKNPQRIETMQSDIDSTKGMFHRHGRLFPNVSRFLLLGNHEDRLRRFLWTSAQALSSLKCLKIEELFSLKDYGINLVPYEQGLMINDSFLVIHGDISSVHSGYTAKRMYEKHGGCGLCGHCHRGGSFYKRDRFGTWGWWENFCLCHLNPDWIKHPNWVQGFSLVHFQGKRFWVEQIPIIDHTLMYGGKVYK